MLSKIAENWKLTDLFEGLENDEQCNELAEEFEGIANYILDSERTDLEASSFIFPTIRRLYKLINKPCKFKSIVNCVDLFLDVEENLKKKNLRKLKSIHITQ